MVEEFNAFFKGNTTGFLCEGKKEDGDFFYRSTKFFGILKTRWIKFMGNIGSRLDNYTEITLLDGSLMKSERVIRFYNFDLLTFKDVSSEINLEQQMDLKNAKADAAQHKAIASEYKDALRDGEHEDLYRKKFKNDNNFHKLINYDPNKGEDKGAKK